MYSLINAQLIPHLVSVAGDVMQQMEIEAQKEN